MSLDPALIALAQARGVATEYEDSERRMVTVAAPAVVAVLGLLGVAAETPEAVAAALADVERSRAARRLAPTVVVTPGERYPLPVPGEVRLEDGSVRPVERRLPADLPLGWHQLSCGDETATLIVVPARLPEPPLTWGWMLQLYALRSAGSWGMGDFGDLAGFTRAASAGGAGFVLLNPLHAVATTHPVQPSPYYPSSRRFINPLYLRVADTDAYRAAGADLRAKIDALAPDDTGDVIDYDAVWDAKQQALELLFGGAQADEPDAETLGFATFCAIAEVHGPNWHAWPAELTRPDSPEVADLRAQRSDRVAFHAWLQQLCRAQLDTVAAAGRSMAVGIVHDLAVGIDPSGADAWTLSGVLADGARIGAPPDSFNQLGQDWGLAAWHPARLAETGYAAWRDLLRRALQGSGGIRVDHVAGLSRLWWIPPNAGAAGGTYVAYDADAMFGILALEASRAGAIVVGEDLGTVPDAVSEGLRGRNMLGSTVLWFARERSGPGFVPPARWPANALASISTHDLPTAYGFLAGEHVRVRAALGLLAHDITVEQANADAERARLLEMLSALGGGPPDGDRAIVDRMHEALAASPSRLIALSLYDVLGELRQPNLPGTVDQYPNWRLRLPADLDRVFADPRVAEVTRMVRQHRPVSTAGGAEPTA